MNTELFLWIHSIRAPWLDRVMLFCSSVGDAWNGLIVLALLLLALAVPAWRARARAALRIYAPAYALMGGLSNGLKQIFAAPRPPLALPDQVRPLGYIPDSYSFPSGHATFAAMLLVLLWPLALPWQRVLLAGWAVLVGYSRISVGAHFPIDVLAGWMLGLAIGAVVWRFAQPKTASV